MPAQGYFLTEGDREAINMVLRLLREHGSEILSQPQHRQPESQDLTGTTQCYIARTPYGINGDGVGIPALTRAGDDELRTRDRDQGFIFYNKADVPGKALCDIYRIVRGGEPLADRLVPLPLVAQWVYNLSDQTVPENSWIPITRDKAGSWIFRDTTAEGSIVKPVRITGSIIEGRYPAIIDYRDENVPRWFPVSPSQIVWAIGYNDEILTNGQRYKGLHVSVNPADNVSVYSCTHFESGGGRDRPGASVYRQTNLSVNGDSLIVPFDGVFFDTSGLYNPVTNEFVIRDSGEYLIGYNLYLFSSEPSSDSPFVNTAINAGNWGFVCIDDQRVHANGQQVTATLAASGLARLFQGDRVQVNFSYIDAAELFIGGSVSARGTSTFWITRTD